MWRPEPTCPQSPRRIRCPPSFRIRKTPNPKFFPYDNQCLVHVAPGAPRRAPPYLRRFIPQTFDSINKYRRYHYDLEYGDRIRTISAKSTPHGPTSPIEG